jgi:DNA-binding IscR family transcriptional regulator
LDHALHALAEPAAAPPGPVKAEQLGAAQQIPLELLENVLLELRRADLLEDPGGRRWLT